MKVTHERVRALIRGVPKEAGVSRKIKASAKQFAPQIAKIINGELTGQPGRIARVVKNVATQGGVMLASKEAMAQASRLLDAIVRQGGSARGARESVAEAFTKLGTGG